MTNVRPSRWYSPTHGFTRRVPRTDAEQDYYRRYTGKNWTQTSSAKRKGSPMKRSSVNTLLAPTAAVSMLGDGAIDLNNIGVQTPFEARPSALKKCSYSQFPYCCGCNIMVDFPYDVSPTAKTDMYNDIPLVIQRSVIERRGFILATTNHSQTKAAQCLREFGFTPIAVVHNPNYQEQTVITTWIYIIAKNGDVTATVSATK